MTQNVSLWCFVCSITLGLGLIGTTTSTSVTLYWGKDSCDDRRVLGRVNTYWFKDDYLYLDDKPQKLALVNDDLRLSVNIS